MTNSKIQRNVMRRVRTAHILRPILSTRVISFAVGLIALWGIGHEVFVAQVIANMPSVTDVAALTRFVTVAFVETDILVQSLTVLVFVAIVWFAQDTIRSLTPRRFA